MDPLAWIDSEVALRLGLAIVFGGALGFEREAHGRAAGLRTLILVCMGSTLITMASALLPLMSGTNEPEIVRVDPGRIAAGIVTGVGFLGGAVVIKLGDLVRGVTTAASIWFVAAIGIVLGQGHYLMASYATALGLLVLGLFPVLGRIVHQPVYRRVSIETRADQADEARRAASAIFDDANIRVLDLLAEQSPDARTELIYHVRAAQQLQAADIVGRLASVATITSVRWH